MASAQATAKELFELMTAIGRAKAVRDPMQMLVAESELTPPQLHTLSWIALDGALTMGELARRIGVTEKTMTGVVDRLEREALVERVRDTGDRRVVHVHLTAAGKRQAQRLMETAQESLVAFLGILDDEDRAGLLRILGKVRDRMTALAAAAAQAKVEKAARR